LWGGGPPVLYWGQGKRGEGSRREGGMVGRRWTGPGGVAGEVLTCGAEELRDCSRARCMTEGTAELLPWARTSATTAPRPTLTQTLTYWWAICVLFVLLIF